MKLEMQKLIQSRLNRALKNKVGDKVKKTIITPAKLVGSITVPASKSLLHRAIICASLCKGKSSISNFILSEDIIATIDCMKELGAAIEISGEKIEITGISENKKSCHLECNESGSTLRFLVALVGALGVNTTFTGKGNLPYRPVDELTNVMNGCVCEQEGDKSLPLNITGKLKSGDFYISGSTSSQYISGLLFALPLLDGDSNIFLTSKLESEAYVNMTIEVLKHFGITAQKGEEHIHIKGNQKYVCNDYVCDQDWSQAAFFLVANALGSEIKLKNMNLNSSQGDREIVSILESIGAEIKYYGKEIELKADKLKSFDIDASQIPDLVPILAVLGCFGDKVSRIYNAKRLIIKESNRLKAISEGLNNIGGKVEVTEDGLLIYPVKSLSGGKADGFGDHRIVMALAIASTVSSGEVIIYCSQSINKSYPSFFEDFNQLGGKANVINVG